MNKEIERNYKCLHYQAIGTMNWWDGSSRTERQKVKVNCNGILHSFKFKDKQGREHDSSFQCPEWRFRLLIQKIKIRFPNQHTDVKGKLMSFENYDFSRVKGLCEARELNCLKTTLKNAIMEDWQSYWQKIFISGLSGIGKTHLAISMLQEIFDAHPYTKIECISLPGNGFEGLEGILELKKYDWKPDWREAFEFYGKLIRETNFLLIDDVGRGNIEKHQESFGVMLQNYPGKLILTSNQPIKDLPYEPRVKTRLHLKCKEIGIIRR